MEDQMIELLGGLQQAIEGIAPTAWAALVMAAFIKSILFFPFTIFVIGLDWAFIRKAKGWWSYIYEHDLEIPYCIGCAVLAVLNVAVIVDLFTAKTWIGLFDPESRAVLDLIDLATR